MCRPISKASALLAILALGLSGCPGPRATTLPGADSMLAPGSEAPLLAALEWLNGPAPQTLSGNVTVIDVFATW